MKPQNLIFRKWIGFSLITLALLAGCGGGGGEGSPFSNTSPGASSSGVINGTATNGPVSGATVTAMMNDASDGRMDGMITDQGGMMGSHQVEMGGGMMGGTMMPADAGTRGLADATAQFVNSPMNRSGLTMQDMQNLISKLTASNGVIQ